MTAYVICNSDTMVCPHVRGDNPRALASGLSYVQVDKLVYIFYTTYISVDLSYHEIVRAKVGKGGIKMVKAHFSKNDRYFKHDIAPQMSRIKFGML